MRARPCPSPVLSRRRRMPRSQRSRSSLRVGSDDGSRRSRAGGRASRRWLRPPRCWRRSSSRGGSRRRLRETRSGRERSPGRANASRTRSSEVPIGRRRARGRPVADVDALLAPEATTRSERSARSARHAARCARPPHRSSRIAGSRRFTIAQPRGGTCAGRPRHASAGTFAITRAASSTRRVE